MTDQSYPHAPNQSSPEELEAARQVGQAIFQTFVDAQKARHGEDWQAKFAAEMAKHMVPVMKAFLPQPKEPAVTPQETTHEG